MLDKSDGNVIISISEILEVINELGLTETELESLDISGDVDAFSLTEAGVVLSDSAILTGQSSYSIQIGYSDENGDFQGVDILITDNVEPFSPEFPLLDKSDGNVIISISEILEVINELGLTETELESLDISGDVDAFSLTEAGVVLSDSAILTGQSSYFIQIGYSDENGDFQGVDILITDNVEPFFPEFPLLDKSDGNVIISISEILEVINELGLTETELESLDISGDVDAFSLTEAGVVLSDSAILTGQSSYSIQIGYSDENGDFQGVDILITDNVEPFSPEFPLLDKSDGNVIISISEILEVINELGLTETELESLDISGDVDAFSLTEAGVVLSDSAILTGQSSYSIQIGYSDENGDFQGVDILITDNVEPFSPEFPLLDKSDGNVIISISEILEVINELGLTETELESLDISGDVDAFSLTEAGVVLSDSAILTGQSSYFIQIGYSDENGDFQGVDILITDDVEPFFPEFPLLDKSDGNVIISISEILEVINELGLTETELESLDISGDVDAFSLTEAGVVLSDSAILTGQSSYFIQIGYSDENGDFQGVDILITDDVEPFFPEFPLLDKSDGNVIISISEILEVINELGLTETELESLDISGDVDAFSLTEAGVVLSDSAILTGQSSYFIQIGYSDENGDFQGVDILITDDVEPFFPEFPLLDKSDGNVIISISEILEVINELGLTETELESLDISGDVDAFSLTEAGVVLSDSAILTGQSSYSIQIGYSDENGDFQGVDILITDNVVETGPVKVFFNGELKFSASSIESILEEGPFEVDEFIQNSELRDLEAFASNNYSLGSSTYLTHSQGRLVEPDTKLVIIVSEDLEFTQESWNEVPELNFTNEEGFRKTIEENGYYEFSITIRDFNDASSQLDFEQTVQIFRIQDDSIQISAIENHLTSLPLFDILPSTSGSLTIDSLPVGSALFVESDSGRTKITQSGTTVLTSDTLHFLSPYKDTTSFIVSDDSENYTITVDVLDEADLALVDYYVNETANSTLGAKVDVVITRPYDDPEEEMDAIFQLIGLKDGFVEVYDATGLTSLNEDRLSFTIEQEIGLITEEMPELSLVQLVTAESQDSKMSLSPLHIPFSPENTEDVILRNIDKSLSNEEVENSLRDIYTFLQGFDFSVDIEDKVNTTLTKIQDLRENEPPIANSGPALLLPIDGFEVPYFQDSILVNGLEIIGLQYLDTTTSDYTLTINAPGLKVALVEDFTNSNDSIEGFIDDNEVINNLSILPDSLLPSTSVAGLDYYAMQEILRSGMVLATKVPGEYTINFSIKDSGDVVKLEDEFKIIFAEEEQPTGNRVIIVESSPVIAESSPSLQELLNSKLDGVPLIEYVSFDDLVSKLEGMSEIDEAVWLTENFNGIDFYISQSEGILAGDSSDFFEEFGALFSEGSTLYITACFLMDNPEGIELIQGIQDTMGVDIGASAGPSGVSEDVLPFSESLLREWISPFFTIKDEDFSNYDVVFGELAQPNETGRVSEALELPIEAAESNNVPIEESISSAPSTEESPLVENMEEIHALSSFTEPQKIHLSSIEEVFNEEKESFTLIPTVLPSSKAKEEIFSSTQEEPFQEVASRLFNEKSKEQPVFKEIASESVTSLYNQAVQSFPQALMKHEALQAMSTQSIIPKLYTPLNSSVSEIITKGNVSIGSTYIPSIFDHSLRTQDSSFESSLYHLENQGGYSAHDNFALKDFDWTSDILKKLKEKGEELIN